MPLSKQKKKPTSNQTEFIFIKLLLFGRRLPSDFLTHQQMYRVCAQNSDNDRTQRTDHVASVFERARHGQYTSA